MVRVGKQVGLKHADPDVDTKKIMKAIMALLPEESRVRHTPTDAELTLTLPPGYRGDDGRETKRRPGTD